MPTLVFHFNRAIEALFDSANRLSRPSGHQVPLTRLVLVLLLTLLFHANAHAVGRYHTVGSGETLDGIARTYRVPVYEIAKANNISANAKVKTGSRVFIPGVSPSAKVSAPAPKPVPNPTPRTVSSRSTAPAQPSSSRSSSSSSSGGTITVSKGDTLWGIANKNNITVAELASANGLGSNAQLQVGQKLRLPGAQSSNRQASGNEVTVRSSGGNERTTSSSQTSSTPRLATSASGGGGSIPVREINNAATVPGGASAQGYQWPVKGVVLRNFENQSDSKHFGVDIEVPIGTPVRAAKAGKVVFVGRIPAYGNMVIISHDSTYASCYAYCSTILVQENQSVSRGDVIAKSGDPEKSNSPYLHFQIRKKGDAINPRPFLP